MTLRVAFSTQSKDGVNTAVAAGSWQLYNIGNSAWNSWVGCYIAGQRPIYCVCTHR